MLGKKYRLILFDESETKLVERGPFNLCPNRVVLFVVKLSNFLMLCTLELNSNRVFDSIAIGFQFGSNGS